jgi:hypothetical protein
MCATVLEDRKTQVTHANETLLAESSRGNDVGRTGRASERSADVSQDRCGCSLSLPTRAKDLTAYTAYRQLLVSAETRYTAVTEYPQ